MNSDEKSKAKIIEQQILGFIKVIRDSYDNDSPEYVQANFILKKVISKEDYEKKYHELSDAVKELSFTAVYDASAGCCIPTSEAWDKLEKLSD